MGDREMQQLWLAINDTATKVVSDTPNWESLVPNYDSLRHRFRKEYGLSPNAMRLRMRMQMAQSLLLQGERSVKEVARSVGYGRQHEFTRAFSKCFGVSPTQWRTNSRVFS
jgi:AraC-like DNA-binding protein